jgi:hypothetical protein
MSLTRLPVHPLLLAVHPIAHLCPPAPPVPGGGG